MKTRNSTLPLGTWPAWAIVPMLVGMQAGATPFGFDASGSLNLFPAGGSVVTLNQASDPATATVSAQAAAADSRTGAGGSSVAGSFEALADAGALHVRASGTAGRLESWAGAAGVTAFASASLHDTLFFRPGPSGTAIYAARLELTADLSMLGGPRVVNNQISISGDLFFNGNLVDEAHLDAQLNGTLEDLDTSPPQVHRSVVLTSDPFFFFGSAGSPFTLETRLDGVLALFNEAPFKAAAADLDASHTLRLFIDPVSPGASYTTASGTSYLSPVLEVPDSGASLVLLLGGFAWLHGLRCRSTRAQPDARPAT